MSSSSIEIICHATEDWEKIEQAAVKTFGPGFSKKKLGGHWGNPILLLSWRFEKKESSQLISRIADSVLVNPAEYVQGNQMYLKLSKQAIMSNKLEKGEGVLFKTLVPARQDPNSFWDKHKSVKKQELS
ncbi:MAG: hypothetical protein GOU99_02825 [Candidatus Altiarchaeota archaeon]|nr:hypothetical protein [Candidatus Altiarchaeota archaeon]